jgi:hypothetical protein
VLVTGTGLLARGGAAAQGSNASMEGHPAVGAWILHIEDEEPSIIALTADGVMHDTEFDGTSGLGAWEAADDTTAAFTLIILLEEEDSSLSIQVRGTMTVDASGDTASLSFSLTALGDDGAVYFTGEETGTATRIQVEGPELMGSPVAGWPTTPATPMP